MRHLSALFATMMRKHCFSDAPAPRPNRILRIESLEPRLALDSDGLLLSNDAYLTLSFAGDGVEVAGQSNELSAMFDALAPRQTWQATILRAFQTWTSLTNADIGVVSDGGQPFGAAGTDRGDTRFGDIRIAAIAMAPDIGAVSVPIDGIVGGSWTADVLFNTNFDFQSLDDVYAIALHEAGNVLGLADSTDPLSPLHPGPIPTATTPTATDILNLQLLYGTRIPDITEVDESSLNNNSFVNATELRLNDFTPNDDGDPIDDGSAPSIAYGDIGVASDLDFFTIRSPDDYSGAITVSVRSTGISLLAPRLRVYDEQQGLLQEVASASSSGDTLTITLPGGSSEATYFIQVASGTDDWRAVGGYALSVTFDGINQTSATAPHGYADSTLRRLGQDELRKLFDGDDDDDLNDDLHTDDDALQAVTLESRSEFATSTRFDTTGSISDATDADYYRLRSPVAAVNASVLTVAVRTLEFGALVPDVVILDHNQNVLPSTILANGAGQLIVQVTGISAEEHYFVRVTAADSLGPFTAGNYQLTAAFGEQPAAVQTFATATLPAGVGKNVHKLYVAEPQLFHFLFTAAPVAAGSPIVLLASIYNASQQLVHQIATSPGDTRSIVAVLLGTGTYEVVIQAVSLNGSVTTAIDYELSGMVISDPFVSDPSDPTTHPFYNPDPEAGGTYLYPGGIPSDDPYLWDDFVAAQASLPPDMTLPQLIAALLGDWWTWFWIGAGVAGPPLGVVDTYATPRDVPIEVPSEAGVLSNDVEPSGNAMGAVLIAAPSSGNLTFNANGAFLFEPSPGFDGVVTFTYQTTNFSSLSAITTVTINVGTVTTLGDYDGNGIVDELDLAAWRTQFSLGGSASADGNLDGAVNAADYVLLRKTLGTVFSPPELPGDYNRDSIVNAADYVMWRKFVGTSTVRFTGADGNGDSIVDTNDFDTWTQHFGGTPPTGGGASASFSSSDPFVAFSDAIVPPDSDNNASAAVNSPVTFDRTHERIGASVWASNDVGIQRASDKFLGERATANDSPPEQYSHRIRYFANDYAKSLSTTDARDSALQQMLSDQRVATPKQDLCSGHLRNDLHQAVFEFFGKQFVHNGWHR